MRPGIDYPAITIVFFCHDGEGNYLLNKRSSNCRDEHGRWDPGGGRLEQGHTIEETLSKEIQEEYGTLVIDYEPLGMREVFREHGQHKTHWLALDYLVHVDRSLARNAEPHKFEQIGCFRFSEFPSPMHSQFPTALEKYGHILKRQ